MSHPFDFVEYIYIVLLITSDFVSGYWYIVFYLFMLCFIEGGGDAEWEQTEKERFNEYDKNHDGKLDRTDIKPWILPDNVELAKEEADHLISRADDNKDGQLSEQEIVDHHDDFVGSQATNYGAFLPKEEL
jgi:Ca2+-binding EF-hand superfamily protein